MKLFFTFLTIFLWASISARATKYQTIQHRGIRFNPDLQMHEHIISWAWSATSGDQVGHDVYNTAPAGYSDDYSNYIVSIKRDTTGITENIDYKTPYTSTIADIYRLFLPHKTGSFDNKHYIIYGIKGHCQGVLTANKLFFGKLVLFDDESEARLAFNKLMTNESNGSMVRYNKTKNNFPQQITRSSLGNPKVVDVVLGNGVIDQCGGI